MIDGADESNTGTIFQKRALLALGRPTRRTDVRAAHHGPQRLHARHPSDASDPAPSTTETEPSSELPPHAACHQRRRRRGRAPLKHCRPNTTLPALPPLVTRTALLASTITITTDKQPCAPAASALTRLPASACPHRRGAGGGVATAASILMRLPCHGHREGWRLPTAGLGGEQGAITGHGGSARDGESQPPSCRRRNEEAARATKEPCARLGLAVPRTRGG